MTRFEPDAMSQNYHTEKINVEIHIGPGVLRAMDIGTNDELQDFELRKYFISAFLHLQR